MKKRNFSEIIVEWYQDHRRSLPWRNTQEPYKIWLSEIILQQTRVIQGLPYYKKFLRKFPNIKSLANASEQEVLRLWQGLGYYTRARNLLKCARFVVKNFQGQFPTSFSELKKLPGIGDYTAAAIASFAYHEPVAVVDGNVYRVLSRYFGVDHSVSSPSGKRFFSKLANELILTDDPGQYNQAIMEFGALQCVPKNPLCDECVLKKNCFAAQHQKQEFFPVKNSPKKSRRRFFYYFLVRNGEKILMKRRNDKDIWHGLFDFPLREENRNRKAEDLMGIISAGRSSVENGTAILVSGSYKHLLTHQEIHARFIEVQWHRIGQREKESFSHLAKWYSPKQIVQLPKPVLISRYLQDRSIL